MCHSTYLDTYGQKESWPPQNHLALYYGEREDNGGLEVLEVARPLANDRDKWKKSSAALCATEDEEDR